MTLWFPNFRYLTSNRTVKSEPSLHRHQSKSFGKSEGKSYFERRMKMPVVFRN